MRFTIRLLCLAAFISVATAVRRRPKHPRSPSDVELSPEATPAPEVDAALDAALDANPDAAVPGTTPSPAIETHLVPAVILPLAPDSETGASNAVSSYSGPDSYSVDAKKKPSKSKSISSGDGKKDAKKTTTTTATAAAGPNIGSIAADIASAVRTGSAAHSTANVILGATVERDAAANTAPKGKYGGYKWSTSHDSYDYDSPPATYTSPRPKTRGRHRTQSASVTSPPIAVYTAPPKPNTTIITASSAGSSRNVGYRGVVLGPTRAIGRTRGYALHSSGAVQTFAGAKGSSAVSVSAGYTVGGPGDATGSRNIVVGGQNPAHGAGDIITGTIASSGGPTPLRGVSGTNGMRGYIPQRSSTGSNVYASSSSSSSGGPTAYVSKNPSGSSGFRPSVLLSSSVSSGGSRGYNSPSPHGGSGGYSSPNSLSSSTEFVPVSPYGYNSPSPSISSSTFPGSKYPGGSSSYSGANTVSGAPSGESYIVYSPTSTIGSSSDSRGPATFSNHALNAPTNKGFTAVMKPSQVVSKVKYAMPPAFTGYTSQVSHSETGNPSSPYSGSPSLYSESRLPSASNPYASAYSSEAYRALGSGEVYRSPNSNEIYRAPSSNEIYRAPNSNEIYRAPSSNEIYRAPSSNEIYRAPSSSEIYRAHSSSELYRAPSETYSAPNSGEIYRAPSSGEIYRSPSSGEIYRSPSSGEIYRSPSSGEIYRAPSSDEVYRAPSSSEIYKAPSSSEVYRAPSSSEAYKASSSSEAYKTSSSSEEHRASSSSEASRAPKAYKDPSQTSSSSAESSAAGPGETTAGQTLLNSYEPPSGTIAGSPGPAPSYSVIENNPASIEAPTYGSAGSAATYGLPGYGSIYSPGSPALTGGAGYGPSPATPLYGVGTGAYYGPVSVPVYGGGILTNPPQLPVGSAGIPGAPALGALGAAGAVAHAGLRLVRLAVPQAVPVHQPLAVPVQRPLAVPVRLPLYRPVPYGVPLARPVYPVRPLLPPAPVYRPNPLAAGLQALFG